jgi:mono/diheme cytochrome c family protein
VGAACLLVAACQQEMAVQPSVRPDEAGGNRPLVAGTVARGHLRADAPLYTGHRQLHSELRARPASLVGTARNPWEAIAIAVAQAENDYVEDFPIEVNRHVLDHGYNRFMIYCVVCHDALGTGHGKIVERGYTPPPSFHIQRLREAPVGHFFDVITNGYGSMPEYKQQIPPHDRWAIVAYIRALQLSQHFPERDLNEEMRKQWDEQKEKQAAAGRQEP